MADDGLVTYHRVAFVLMSILELSVSGTCFRRTVEVALAEALEACKVQCRSQEMLLEAAGAADLEAHRQEHRALLDRLAVACLCIDESAALVELLEFLREWWPAHVWQREMA